MAQSICIAFLFVLINFASCKVFFCNEDQTKIIEFAADSPFCKVHTDRNYVNDILSEDEVMFVDDNILDKMEAPCIEKQEYGFIFPGTLWCGQGTKARFFNELGEHREEDKCCREHDNCANSLNAGECRGDVCNDSSYTRSHCDCDLRFQECLKSTQTSAGNVIGSIFFNIVKVSCFTEDNCDNKLGELINFDEQGRKTCPIKFESAPKYRVERLRTLNGRKLNFFERFLRKIRLL
ncbi:acidic phospholipase A2 PA4-like [Onthophagus taurus]|uniref:acidic phospholipase A2 PA4-like n=1 Tax=Onthophagus taurus TaxID=166361 RepID=UPI0039BE9FE1